MRRFFGGVGAAALVAVVAIARGRPPRPLGEGAPPAEFSAGRARRILETLAGDGRPHPEGSPEAAAVRDRVAAAFRALGDVPEIRRGFACGRNGVCGAVENVVVRRAGTQRRKAVLLSAHYDSVAAGPGASDDAMGVAAVLEIARALRRAPLRRPVVFLVDDGEEQGLLGAEAFASEEGGGGVIADVNIEARGTGGTSYLFETSEGNLWLARLFGRLPHPATSSLFYAVYRTLPNDTDLTVFRAHGMAGVNFACVEGVARYHTPRDDVAHASLSTLQHQGENALAIARALDRAPEKPPRGDAVWFDLFGAAIVRWPAEATLPAAGAAMILLVVGIAGRLRRRSVSFGRVLLGAAAFPAAILAGAAGAAAVTAALRAANAVPAGWIAHPATAAAAFWLAALLGSGAAAAALGRRAGPGGLRAGIAVCWGAAAVFIAWREPAASFPFLVPAVIGALLLLPPRSTGTGETALLAAGGFFLLPLAWVLLEVLGFRGARIIGAILGLAVTLFAARLVELPVRFRRRLAAVFAGALLLSLAAAFVPAPLSFDVPQRATIVALEDAGSGSARWIVETDADRLPRGLRAAAPFRPEAVYPWAPKEKVFAAKAPTPALPAPELRIESDATAGGARRILGRLVSPRGAGIVRIAFAPGTALRTIAIGGVATPPLSPAALARGGGWRSYACVTVPPEGIPVEISAAPGPVSFVLSDRSPGLPASAAPLAARRGPFAVPSQSGDGTIVMKTFTL